MTQTLLALAAYEDHPGAAVMTHADYYKLFSRYVLAQHQTLKDGHAIDWIDEDLDAEVRETLQEAVGDAPLIALVEVTGA